MSDLLDLIQINRRYEMEDNLAARKAARPARSAATKRGQAKARAAELARFFATFTLKGDAS